MPKHSYVLNVDGPVPDQDGLLHYRDKDTGEDHSGWYHCGCCGRDGFASAILPVCTDCCNCIRGFASFHGKSTSEIRQFCREQGMTDEQIDYALANPI